jgi:hypothetical protein
VQWYPAGFSIVEQGEPANRLYLILSGTAEVLREDADGVPHGVAQIGPGTFFGEDGLAHGQPRNAHVVAVNSVTCLVFAPGEPTAFAGRGATASQDLDITTTAGEVLHGEVTTAINVTAYVDRKMAAIAAHRTQYPLDPTMLPLMILQEMMGREYFVRVAPARELETELLIHSQSTPVIKLNDQRRMRAVDRVAPRHRLRQRA